MVRILERWKACRKPCCRRKKGRRRKRVALLRRPPDARAVFNADDVQDFLQAEGFSAIDPGLASFADQMRLFREAELVVGSLGSGLVGSLFGRPHQRLISLAPSGWADGYFIRLFQHLDACHADLRGPSVEQNGVAADRAPHRIAVEELAAAMAVVLQPETRSARRVDGEMLPGRLGAEVLRLPLQADGLEHDPILLNQESGSDHALALCFGEHFNPTRDPIRSDNALVLTSGGWSAPEPTHRWSLGPSSGLRFARSRLPRGMAFWLEIEGQGHVYPPELPTRPLDVLVNGKPAGRFDVIGRARYFCLIPAEMLGDSDDVALTFLHPVCPSPRQMGVGEDDRPLGFGFERLVFYKTD